ncbi:MAG: ABC transporter permease [Chitinispirillaceae bacterium]
MKYIIKMAIRNVGRNKRRSVLAAVSVALSVMLIVFMQGMIGGVMRSMVRNYTKNETGHIRITTKEYQEKQRFSPVAENLQSPREIIQEIKNDPEIHQHVKQITQRIRFGTLMTNKGKSREAMIVAGDPRKERSLLMLDRSIKEGGRFLQKKREIVLGSKLAAALGYSIGDTVDVVTQASDYSLNLRNLVISGLFETGMNSLDESAAFISLDDAKKLLRMRSSTQQIVLMLDDHRKADRVASLIDTRLQNEDLAVTPWTQIGDYGNIVKMSESTYRFIYALIALLGAFIIGNIMVMVVMERRKEIGIMKSMGLKRKEILGLFLSEGMILGTVGSLFGIVLGGLIVTYFHFKGIDFSSMMNSFRMPLDNVIYFTLNPLGFLKVMLLAAVVSALVSLGPSWKASRLNPVESMKSV